MSSLSLKVYKDVIEFLKKVETELLVHECQNTFILLMIKKAAEEAQKTTCLAVYKDQTLVYATFLYSGSILYGSYIVKEEDVTAVDLCLEYFQDQLEHLSWIHAYQPALGRIQTVLNRIPLKLVDRVWAYTIQTVHWTEQSKALAQDPTLEVRQLSIEDLDWVLNVTVDFLEETTTHSTNMIRPHLSAIHIEHQLRLGNIFALFFEGQPVSTVCKARPTDHGISLTFVYTLKPFRGRGFAQYSVTVISDMLLRDYSFIALFVDADKNKYSNLYTQMGYHYAGEAGRLILMEPTENK